MSHENRPAAVSSRPMDITSVPRNSAEGRALLQQRIALFGRTVFLLLLVLTVTGFVVVSLPPPGGWPTRPAPPVHILAVAALGALWLVCRRGKRSLRTLAILDGVSTFVAAAALAAVIFIQPAQIPTGV